ncbi:MAG: baseplate J/gp47 family protein [Microcoleus sp.]
MPTRYEPLPNPVLDPRNERTLVELAIGRIYERSNRTLNDFSPGSVLRVFAEMQAFVAAEALYFLNKLPFAFVIQFLQIFGIQRRLGTPAIATLRFNLSQPLTEAYIIPAGTQVNTADRRLKFTTNEQLVIPVGQVSGEVAATCAISGAVGNVPRYQINTLTQSRPYLASVLNPTDATGGTNAESIKETQTRAMLALRRRSVVSRDDYEQKARSLLGLGSVVVAKGNVGQDRRSQLPGCVHLFCLNADGSQPNDAQRLALRTAILPFMQVGIELFVSPIAVQPVFISVIVRQIPSVNPQVVAATIGGRLRSFLAPANQNPGTAILLDDLRRELHQIGGIDFVEHVSIGESASVPKAALNFPLKDYTVAKVEQVEISISDGRNAFRFNA